MSAMSSSDATFLMEMFPFGHCPEGNGDVSSVYIVRENNNNNNNNNNKEEKNKNRDDDLDNVKTDDEQSHDEKKDVVKRIKTRVFSSKRKNVSSKRKNVFVEEKECFCRREMESVLTNVVKRLEYGFRLGCAETKVATWDDLAFKLIILSEKSTSCKCTDIAKISRKRSKPDKHGYETEKSVQEPKNAFKGNNIQDLLIKLEYL
ncbi:hypothetical protein Tco_0329268 [Tanacetum coccineum]